MSWFSSLFLKDGNNKQAPPADSNHELTAIKISAQELYSDYHENVIAADIKYKGKIIKVTGLIGRIDKDYRRGAYIVLESAIYASSGGKISLTKSLHPTVWCYFDLKDEPQLVQVRRGQKISAQGKCEGRAIDYVSVKNCVLAR